ncbi:hypothetical protein PUN28_000447 [Cardiocondyla obscurior]|uniref:Uncharacterized protein n=1 Tax=Cardiocondyla obscurior TaxID=286306 RepID=A0AAW2GZJ4_9HYME
MYTTSNERGHFSVNARKQCHTLSNEMKQVSLLKSFKTARHLLVTTLLQLTKLHHAYVRFILVAVKLMTGGCGGKTAAVAFRIYLQRKCRPIGDARNRPRKYIDARCYKLTTRIIIVLNSARMAGGKSDIVRRAV